MFYCHVKHRTGEKETREMKGERVNQSQFFFKVFVWIITIVLKVAGANIICLS